MGVKNISPNIIQLALVHLFMYDSQRMADCSIKVFQLEHSDIVLNEC